MESRTGIHMWRKPARASQANRRTRMTRLEFLEGRAVPSATPLAPVVDVPDPAPAVLVGSPVAGETVKASVAGARSPSPVAVIGFELRITGTRMDDNVSVFWDQVNDRYIATMNDNVLTVERRNIRWISIRTGDGNDRVCVDPYITVTAFGFLGRGDDLYEGGGGTDIVRGDGGNDTLLGGPGNDRLFGQRGRDILYGGLGADYMNGGCFDPDTYYLDQPGDRAIRDNQPFVVDIFNKFDPSAVPALPAGWRWNAIDGVLVVDRATAYNTREQVMGERKLHVTWDTGVADFISISRAGILGTEGPDTIDLRGLFVPVTIVGRGGNDTLYGGKADDTIVGGLGADIVYGGPGKDILDLRDGAAVDIPADFEPFEDTLLGDQGGGPLTPAVIVNDVTGAVDITGNLVDMQPSAQPAPGIFYVLRVDGTLWPVNPFRANGPITVRVPSLAAFTITTGLRSDLDAAGLLTVIVVGGGNSDLV